MPSERKSTVRKIAALQRRRDHLADRLANSRRPLSYDRAELVALEWAIRRLRPPVRDAVDD